MNRQVSRWLGWAAVALFTVGSRLSAAEGMTTAFADVQISGVPLGRDFNLVKQGKRMDLTNLGSQPLHVTIQVLIPKPEQLKPSAEAIADPRWVQIVPQEVDLPAHGRVNFDVIVHVPWKWKHRHKTFQAMILSRGAPKLDNRGMGYGAALLSRLRVSTKP